jgi:dCMP deaminase
MSSRPSREAILFYVVQNIAERSTCDRLHVGAVIAREGRIISTGYNGAPSGLPHCSTVGCEIDPDTQRCVRTVHAEINAIVYAAKFGTAIEDTELYTTDAPCLDCAKAVINSGIKKVFWLRDYHDTRGVRLLQEAGLEVGRYDASQS